MKLSIENETHWRSQDISRLVRASLSAARVRGGKPRRVVVSYSPDAHWGCGYRGKPLWEEEEEEAECEVLRLFLPKRGPRSGLLKNEMFVLALAAANVEIHGLLAPETTFSLAGFIAGRTAEQFDTGAELDAPSHSQPSWAASATVLLIRKYADPARASRYAEERRRIECEIEECESSVEHHQRGLEEAEAALKVARSNLRELRQRVAQHRRRLRRRGQRR